MNIDMLLVLTLIWFFLTLYFYRRLWQDNVKLRERIQDLESEKQSMAVRYGKMTEQFIPFLKNYPYRGENFRFIGTPVDGIQFEDDKIVFIEFKTGKSELSEAQKRVRNLIHKGKVYFEEVRLDEKQQQNS